MKDKTFFKSKKSAVISIAAKNIISLIITFFTIKNISIIRYSDSPEEDRTTLILLSIAFYISIYGCLSHIHVWIRWLGLKIGLMIGLILCYPIVIPIDITDSPPYYPRDFLVLSVPVTIILLCDIPIYRKIFSSKVPDGEEETKPEKIPEIPPEPIKEKKTEKISFSPDSYPPQKEFSLEFYPE